MVLHVHTFRERLTDEEIEQKFQLLTLAFAIDAVTLGDRLERQQRQRDQAEDNLTREVTKFIQAVHRLNPLCVDAETTELVTSLLSHLDLIVQVNSTSETFLNVLCYMTNICYCFYPSRPRTGSQQVRKFSAAFNSNGGYQTQ